MLEEKIILDGVHWYISNRQAQPLCPIHNLRLKKDTSRHRIYSDILLCADCPDKNYPLPRMYDAQIQYLLDKIDSKIFKNMRTINLDDEAIPLAETKLSPKDEKYFVTGLLTKSKVGLRLIMYVGEKGSSKKSQIFIEPEIRRLAFDQKNLHPADIFAKVEATFKDGTKHVLIAPTEMGQADTKNNAGDINKIVLPIERKERGRVVGLQNRRIDQTEANQWKNSTK